ncbi:alpha-amylase a type-1 2 [Lichtheimia corymbifera JMRC:FSU:9682]|uniref:Alpha-amylase n=1 Tax=Lichtheimia corymbifera JMRC:FSU:9682 TaxID=1263082 RepID=A0A068SFP3_9FUNG|nr:alpha-amylase a type-1 2 [Lichtheimia corymbifera JMRC:FSU:9682]
MKFKHLSILAATCALFTSSVLARPVTITKRASADDWRDRAIYQILTDRFARSDGSTDDCTDLSNYCGGNFQGIIKQLDYIEGMGFDAIWISPIPANSEGGYHGYWATDFYSLNDHFGSQDDLQALVDAAHERGMYVMLDVVANHAGPTNNGDYSGYTFGSSDLYHPQCSIDYNDQNSIEQCWVADNLPDIDTENDSNVNKLHDIVSTWISTYGFDGIRIDTVKHVRKDFWSGYAAAAGVFATGEVFDGNQDYVAPYQEQLDSLHNFPLYYALKDVFASKSGFQRLSDQRNANMNAFKDVSLLTTFVDNHDVVRFLNANNDQALFKNALAYVLLSEGIPVVYYGSEQGFAGGADPANREALWSSGYDTSSDLYQFIATINNHVRQRSGKKVYMDLDVQDNVYAFMHGDALVVLNNFGSGASNQVSVNVGAQVAESSSFTDAISGTSITVSSGSVTFTLENGNPAIFVPA